MGVRVEESLEGFATAPIGYLEGWYVKEDSRQKGIGRELVKAGEEWARSKGCQEIASDVEKENAVSLEAHRRLGFVEYGSNEDEALFRKRI